MLNNKDDIHPRKMNKINLKNAKPEKIKKNILILSYKLE